MIIFPFGGNARESLLSILVADKKDRRYDIIGFIDDDPANLGRACCGVKVLGGRELLKDYPRARILAVPGSPDNYLKRKVIITGLNIGAQRFITLAHPSAVISQDAKVGYNTLLMANTVISCGVQIGSHCIILPNTVIAHDNVIGDYCCIGANVTVSGHCRIGAQCYIGSGSNIREKINIGAKTFLGLGSNVVSDIEEGVVVVGNPAKVLRKAEV